MFFRKPHGDLTPTKTEKAFENYKSSEYHCPVCRTKIQLIEGLNVQWKASLIEPSKKEVSHQKCHVNLNKKETAQLFAFLMQSGFFSFDEDERKNRALLTKFIETHFTYNGENETKSVIKNMNQEFTPLFHPNEKNQLPFITKLIDILEIRKSNLE